MNKEELVKEISKKTKLSQKVSSDVLSATLEIIQKTVAKGKKVTLVGFGTWEARKRAARTGRNPQTGKELKIAATLAQGLLDAGMDIVGGMTENHLMTLDLRKTGKTGKDMANVLERVGITANKNTVPNDPQSPFVTSGIRLGAAAMTTRGFVEEDMREVARIIAEAIKNSDNEEVLAELKKAFLSAIFDFAYGLVFLL